jgi:hypothetical protein
MFDLGRLTETLSGFLGNSAQQVLEGNPLLETLQNSGIDLSNLAGLDAQQVIEQLTSQGIDLTQFAPEQLQQLLGSLNIDPSQLGDLGSIVGSFLERR